jgi:hypothetical protein
MAKAFHTIRYRYTCEQCGHQTEWFEKTLEGETNLLGTAIEEVLPGTLGESAGRALASDELAATIRGYKERVALGNYTFFDHGKSCPQCGRHQSWLPIHDVSSIPPGGRVALYGLGFFAAGLIVFLIAFLITIDSAEQWAQDLGMAIGLGALIVLPAVGIIKAIRRNKRDAAENKAQQSATTTKNAPEIDWNE